MTEQPVNQPTNKVSNESYVSTIATAVTQAPHCDDLGTDTSDLIHLIIRSGIKRIGCQMGYPATLFVRY